MVKEIETKLYEVKNKKIYIYLPKKLVEDSLFPFKAGQEIRIRIEGDKLVIEKV